MSSRRGAGSGSRGDDSRRSISSTLSDHLAKEDPDTDSPEVAILWANAYTQLADFEEKTLKSVMDLLPSLSPEARHEAELTNLPMIAQHLQTFRYRRAHWRKRVEELARV